MAAGRLSAPGTKLGPCAGECKHIDCAETRRMAASPCRWCRAPIGYVGTDRDAAGEFYAVGGEYAHAICEEEALEEERHGARPEPA